MSFLGETNEKVTGVHAVLKLGSSSFRLKTDFRLHIGRPKNRQATSAGPCLTFGAGDHFLDATIIGTAPDIATLNALTQRDVNGELSSSSWSLVLAPSGGGTNVTVAFTGPLPEFDIVSVDEEQPIEFEIHIDIDSDTVTVS
ncbi:hypothetical protein K0U27_00735 [archaeon]|nr:hypothetical protein [archaeon]